MELYGITTEINKVSLLQYDVDKHDNVLQDFPVFTGTEKGIDILIYTLDRLPANYKPEGSRWSKSNVITRLETPFIDSKGKERKYNIPKGAGTLPFFPPPLIDKYEQKVKIKTLAITEGYFKAFKGAMHGLDIVGLSSITHYKDREKGTLHGDIIRLIRTCQVENVIWLADGDCNRISLKALAAGEDIYKRPNQFYSSCESIRRLLDDYDVQKYFCYVESTKVEGLPKGLDDLLIALPGKEEEVVEDLISLSRPPVYFFREDMTYNAGKIRKHFRLHNINEFVEYHCEVLEQFKKLATGDDANNIPDLKKKEFVWIGTKYIWDEKENACKVVVPGDAKKYFRVGDQYYEKVEIPNKYGELEKTFHRRMKQTIIDDYGKPFVEHIPKYKAFCNVPDHNNYQEIIHSCYNMYFPFEHDAYEGDMFYTMSFLKHIFGEKEIKVKHKEKGELAVTELDLGLDYVQILYKQPQQILPILCLVSREQGTGKTTFVNWLKLLFTQNVAIVGNAELANDFNASWAGKLLVVCEEAKIDKTVVLEKVKALSTGNKIFMNAKGKDHVEIDFFAKFIFNTNNEENFIYAGDDDVRYWVRKVPVVQDLFVNLLEQMKEEIPAFLDFLNKRSLKTEKLHRAWFYPELIKTDALKKVIAYSQSTVEKELRQHIRDMFFDHGERTEILMTLDAINETFFRNKFERNYLRKTLEDNIKVEMYHDIVYQDQEYACLDELKKAVPDFDPKLVKKRQKTRRHSFPRWEVIRVNNEVKRERTLVSGNGRPYVFPRAKFLTPDEIANLWFDPETANDAKILDNNGGSWGGKEDAAMMAAGRQDDLPF